MTTIVDRRYAGLADFWPVRDFLAELRPIVPPGRCWDLRRWDGSHCHTTTPVLEPARAERTRLWEADGRIVAAALYAGGPQLHPQVHPEWVHLADEVIAWGEEAAAALHDERVVLHCWDHDVTVRRIAERRGYAQTDRWEIVYRGRFGEWPIPEPVVPPGYVMRWTWQ